MFSKILSVLALVLFATVGSAQDGRFTYGTDYGFTLKLTATNNYTWENDNAYPFLAKSLQFNSDVANTTTVVRVRASKIYQEVGNVVSTNAQSGVETNYSHAVTNIIVTYLTNTFLSVTNSGSEIYDEADIPQQYILLGDVLRFNFSDNNSKIIIMDAIR